MLSFLLIPFLLRILGADKEKHGLIIVDLQYDFGDPAGSLSVFLGEGGTNGYLNISSSEYTQRVNSFLENTVEDYDFVVYSIDYHPTDHCSFAETMQNLGANVSLFEPINTDPSSHTNNEPWVGDICDSQTGYQVLWPVHCVRGTSGARFMSDIYDIRPQHDTLQRVVVWRDPNEDEEYAMSYDVSNSSILMENTSYSGDLKHVQEDQSQTLEADVSQVFYVFKGRDVNVDSYSVLLGNDGSTPTGLYDAMLAYDYSPDNTDLTVFGIAYDYCVGFTVLDAVDLGYEVTVMDQLTAPVFPNDVPDLIESMIDLGVTIDYSSEWMDMSTTEAMDMPMASAMDADYGSSTDEWKTGFVICAVVLGIVIVVLLIFVVVQQHRHDRKVETKTSPSSAVTPMTDGGAETPQHVVQASN